MLEQELNKQEVDGDANANQDVPLKPQSLPETELFEQYELKSWNFSPRLYQIAAISAIFNIAALGIFTQGNLLTTRGCDSPMVSKVCQVLDTIYVGSTLLGTDSEFVSKDYDPTNLDDAEITYIDVSGQTPPLNYPEGYFALANPEETALRQQQMLMNGENPTGFEMPPSGSIPFPNSSTIPGISSTQPPLSSTPDLMNTKPELPKPNKNPVIGNLPSSTSGNPIAGNKYRNFPPRVKNQRPTKSVPNESSKTLPGDDETAENKTDEEKEPKSQQPDIKSDPVKAVELNKKPFEDFAKDVLDKRESIAFDKPFKVILEGVINKEGKLDKTKSKFLSIKDTGDVEMANLAKSAIEALGESKLLMYLRDIGIDTMTLTLVQNDKEIYAVINSKQISTERARTVSSGFTGLIDGAFLLDRMGTKKLGEDEKLLLKKASSSNKGKEFILNFSIPKDEALKMINRKLDEAQAKKQEQTQPNGTANIEHNQNSAK
jgi:hypothetical protein